MARPILKRESIEHGVVEVIARQGLHATTIKDIAREAQVSPGLLYRYWKDRDDLAAAAYVAHYAALMERLRSAARKGGTPRERMRRMLEEFLRFADTNRTELKFLLLSQHDLGPSIPPTQSVHALVIDLLREGIASHHFRAGPPELAAHMLLGVVLQPIIGVLNGRLPGPVLPYLRPMLETIDRIVRRR